MYARNKWVELRDKKDEMALELAVISNKYNKLHQKFSDISDEERKAWIKYKQEYIEEDTKEKTKIQHPHYTERETSSSLPKDGHVHF